MTGQAQGRGGDFSLQADDGCSYLPQLCRLGTYSCIRIRRWGDQGFQEWGWQKRLPRETVRFRGKHAGLGVTGSQVLPLRGYVKPWGHHFSVSSSIRWGN